MANDKPTPDGLGADAKKVVEILQSKPFARRDIETIKDIVTDMSRKAEAAAKPGQTLGRAIGAPTHKPGGIRFGFGS